MLHSALLAASSLACAGLITLAGCANKDADNGNAATEPTRPATPGVSYEGLAERVVGDWSLAALRGVPIDQLPTDGVRDMPSLRIEPDGRANGAAGVNRWFSSIDLARLSTGAFEFAPAGSTMMAGPEQAMALERGYLSAIGEARRIDPAPLADGSLRLLNADGDEVLRFSRDR